MEIGGARRRIERFFDRHAEARLLRARAVISEVQRLLDHRVDVDAGSVARPRAGVQQHVLDDGIGALAVMGDLLEIGIKHADQVIGLVAVRRFQRRLGDQVFHFADQLARQGREVVDEVERVLDLVRNAGGELAERGELFGLHEPVLRLAQIVERLLELARARLNFVEQADVLDRNHGLIGEGFEKLDLPFVERTHGLPRDDEPANRLAAAHQRRRKQRPVVAAGLVAGLRVFGVGENIGDMDRLSVASCSRDAAARAGRQGMGSRKSLHFCAETVIRDKMIVVAAPLKDGRPVAVAEFCRRSRQRVEHCLQIERRAADNLQHIGGRGLLLQGLGQIARARLNLVEHARVLDRDRRLIGEAAQQIQFPLAERTRWPAHDDDRAQAAILPKHGRYRDRHVANLAKTVLQRRTRAGIRKRVGQMQNAALADDAAGATLLERRHVVASHCQQRPAPRGLANHPVFADRENADLVGPEQVLAGIEDMFEHGTGVGDRMRDRAQHFT